jgi:hypothetical protein
MVAYSYAGENKRKQTDAMEGKSPTMLNEIPNI